MDGVKAASSTEGSNSVYTQTWILGPRKQSVFLDQSRGLGATLFFLVETFLGLAAAK